MQLVLAPDSLGCFYVARLGLLVAAVEQDHQFLAVLAKIEPVAGAIVDLALKNAISDAFHIREVALFQAGDVNAHFRCSPRL